MLKLTCTTIGVVFLLFTFGVSPKREEPAPPNPTPHDKTRPALKSRGPLAALRPQSETNGEIGPGKSHDLTIHLSAQQYVRAFIQHADVDLRVIASRANGDPIADFVCTDEGPIPLSLVSETGEQVRLLIKNDSPKLIASYSITLDTPRQALPTDSDRVEAEHSFYRAERLRQKLTEPSMRAALLEYERAAKGFHNAGDRVATILVLRNTAKTYQALDETRKAVDYYHRALNLAESYPDLTFAADTLNDLAYLFFAFGDNAGAMAKATEALQLSRKRDLRRALARAKFLIGETHYGFGNLTKALSFYDQGLAGSIELKNYRQQIQILISSGYTYGELGEIQKASSSYDKAMALALELGDRRWQAITLRAIGNLQTNLGEKQKALEHLHKAWELIKDFSDSPTKAAVLGALGYIYVTSGEYRLALQYYSGARTLFLAMDHRWGAAELEMEEGNIYVKLGEPQTALNYYAGALKLFRVLGMTRYQAQTLKNIGLAHLLLGNSREAIDYLNQSLRLNRAGQDQRYRAYTLNYLGRAYHNSGKYEKALEYYNQALTLAEIGADLFGKSETLYNKAITEKTLDKLDEALADSKQSLSIVESLRTKVASEYLRSSYLASVHQHYELQIEILMRLHEKHPDRGFVDAAFEASERARARSFLETLAATYAGVHQGVDAELLKRDQELQRELNAKALRQLRLRDSNENKKAEMLDAEIRQLTSDHQEIQGRIRATNPRYAALTQPEPLSLKEIQKEVLDENSLLLEYSLGDERSYVWAVTRQEVSSYELPGREEIERSARNVYDLLTANQGKTGEAAEQKQPHIARRDEQIQFEIEILSKSLIEPVASRLGTKRLLIVADGALQYIPFQVLTKSRAGPGGSELRSQANERIHLFADHEIVNEPSASALALLLTETTNRKPALHSVAVFADPVFESDDPRVASDAAVKNTAKTAESKESETRQALRDIGLTGEQGERVPRLLASADEAEAIMSVAPWWSGFKALGFEANRATAMSPKLEQYRIVHFATHGLLNNEHPELSGIVLTLVDQKGQPQDGFLRLHDIYNLNLPVDLVVLSACNTALGKDVRGEGLIGLTRGFMYAGASSVVASLWKVDDDATAVLMGYFYRYMLQDGLSPSAALRKAQLEMSKQKRWQSPYYWAGFTIQGQYTPTAKANYFSVSGLVIWGGAGVVLVVAGFFIWRARRTRVL